LVDVDHDPAFFVDAEPLGFDVRRDDRELARPVGADGALTTLAPVVHGIRPVDVWRHEGKGRLDVAAVEGSVGPAKKRLAVVHLWYATKRATTGWGGHASLGPPGSLFGCGFVAGKTLVSPSMLDHQEAEAALEALRRRRDEIGAWLDGPAKKATLVAVDRMIAELEREAETSAA
jgi:hypothetical protein